MVCDRCCVGWLKNNLKIVSFPYVFFVNAYNTLMTQSPSGASGIFQTAFKLSGKRMFTPELNSFKASYFPFVSGNLFLSQSYTHSSSPQFQLESCVKFCESRAASLEAKNMKLLSLLILPFPRMCEASCFCVHLAEPCAFLQTLQQQRSWQWP